MIQDLKDKKQKLFLKEQLFNKKNVIIFSLIILFVGCIISAAKIVVMTWSIEKEGALAALFYVMAAGWFLFLPVLPLIIIARKEIWNKIKIFGRKEKVAIFRFIGADACEQEVVLTLDGNTLEHDESKFIVNPKRATFQRGIKIFTYVANNAITHDYHTDPNKTLKQLGEDIKKTDAESLHDIFSDPIRIDAKYFNETFLSASQTNPDMLKKMISFLTSKNIIGMMFIIALAAGAAAFLSLQANNLLNTIPLCQTGTILT